MDQPATILKEGTGVVIREDITAPSFLIRGRYLDARRPGATGLITGVVGGHGGDVYWVRHADGEISAYGFWEFELCLAAEFTLPSALQPAADQPAGTFWDHLNRDEEY